MNGARRGPHAGHTACHTHPHTPTGVRLARRAPSGPPVALAAFLRRLASATGVPEPLYPQCPFGSATEKELVHGHLRPRR